jgi:endonuclease/exonuclease/phosphatase (EEP) superfamily protein YafD
VRSEFWLVRVFDFPRLQITIVFAVVFALYLIVREDPDRADNLLLAAMTLSFVYQLWRMWPYTPLHHKQVQSADREGAERGFSVLISNVLMTNRNSEKLRALIREHDPDVVLVVETDAWWQEELRELERSHPNTLSHPRDNTYGMLLYSRLPLIEPEIRFLVKEDVPSIRTGLRLRSGERVQLYGVHPRPPAPGESTRSTERDAELLIVAKELKDREVPCIVVGDLNDVAWSRTNNLFQKISRLLDPRIGRGFFSTFNANWPLIRFPLDHAFVSHHFRLGAFRVLPHVGSDHFPVFVRLALMPAAREANRPPEPASKSERQEANDKIARAG